MTTETALPMKPSIHSKQSLSNRAYHAIPALSSTRLKALAQSPAACLRAMTLAVEETTPLRLGRALHAQVLEPETYTENFVTEDVNLLTKAGKARRDALQKEQKTLLSLDEAVEISAWKESVVTHPDIKPFFQSAVAEEMTVLWQEGRTLAKARVDLVGDTWALDLKTSNFLVGFSPYEIDRYRYYLQAAWYLRGLQKHLPRIVDFYFAVVSKQEPYESQLFKLDATSLDGGEEEIGQLLPVYESCLLRNTWTRHLPTRVGSITDRRVREIGGDEII